MARYYYSGARDITEDRKKFSIFWLNEQKVIPREEHSTHHGSINWSVNGEPTGNIRYCICILPDNQSYINLIYRIKGSHEPEEDYRSYDYKVMLGRVTCNLGGFRWYFECINCYKRVGVLYSHGDYFVCRRCANLSYESCNQNKRFRGGIFKIIMNETKEEELYKKVKTKLYRGRPTRKFRRYLKCTYGDEWTVPDGYT